MLQKLFNRFKKSTTSSERPNSQVSPKGEPEYHNGELTPEQVQWLHGVLEQQVLKLPSILNAPPHPHLGSDPVRLAVKQHVAALVSTVERGVNLYINAGGIASICSNAEDDILLVYSGSISPDVDQPDRVIFNLSQLLRQRIGEEEATDKFIGTCNTAAEMINTDFDLEKAQALINQIYLASSNGQLLVAWPLIFINGGGQLLLPSASAISQIKGA
ncbi:hypothetical protein Dxin01_00118 [Deinococcus xinjiangensis]|uniref:Uncharacterized protein n=1 Tax=Deinococcus xinjiangensis TaxID=457454 RepID=A0ABP9V532_9DEIO